MNSKNLSIFLLGILISCATSIKFYDCRTILEYEKKDSKGVFYKVGHEFEYDNEWYDFYKFKKRNILFDYNYNYKKIVAVLEDSIIKSSSVKDEAYYPIEKYYRQIEIIDISDSYLKIGVGFLIKSNSFHHSQYLKIPVTDSDTRGYFHIEFNLVNSAKIVEKKEN